MKPLPPQALLGDLTGLILVHGGATRAQSVMAGLAALAWDDEVVLGP